MNTVKHILLAHLLIAPAFAAADPLPEKIEYNRDVRPILADTCFKCHGFDKNTREAGLRLDVRDAAIANNDGVFAIVPGKVAASELWKRINTTDEDDVMPPKKQSRRLSEREKLVLKKWIEQGAEYQSHWAYIPPKKSAVPQVKEPGFSRNEIDAFVLQRHAELGLKHVAEAGRVTLARRLYFDLLGLPPTPAEVDAFVNDKAPDAYERLVEKLLASPHFGERMAVWWLDLVRYADSTGYHSDNPRNVSPYRDYVISAFNENKRFDRFTIEQIAGDLLPEASIETRVASAYNRLTLTTEEGGAQAKQYEAKSVTDRVKSIGTTWLAQTMMCSECHDHKFDPITAKDFYAMGAFFADIKERSIGRRDGEVSAPSHEQMAKVKEFDAKIAAAQQKLTAPSPEIDAAQEAWEKANAGAAVEVAWSPLQPSDLGGASKLTAAEAATIKVDAAGNPAADTYVFTITVVKGVTGLKLEALSSSALPGKGPGRAANGNFILTEIVASRDGKPVKFSQATATFEQSGFPAKSAIDGKKDGKDNGWGVMGNAGKDAALYLELAEPVAADGKLAVQLVQLHGDNHTIGKLRLSSTVAPKPVRVPSTGIPADIVALLKVERAVRTPEQKLKLAAHFRGISPALDAVKKEVAALQKQRADFEKSFGKCLVTESMPNPRVVRVLPRGDWQNETGEVMQPATPRFLPALVESKEGKQATRLDLAKWLVSRENPLTARVFVNRLWKQFYGTGLSKTLEDMGTQGEIPSNQALLDWLALSFVDSGWDVKGTIRLMVTSGTYRLSSVAPAELQARDPANRALASQGRWRIDAEFVRDNALSLAGLIVHKIGGPSVKPYQPAGYWENLNFPVREWDNDKGENQWRRGLYTWWQRSYLHPMMLAFDAPTREECAADRLRSNIPQQALALLNDPQFVEAARAFAARMITEGGTTPDERIAWAWKMATSRAAKQSELRALRSLLDKHLSQFSADAKTAEGLLGVGLSPQPKVPAKPELAAYASVARAILNLHETITRL